MKNNLFFMLLIIYFTLIISETNKFQIYIFIITEYRESKSNFIYSNKIEILDLHLNRFIFLLPYFVSPKC